MKAQGIVLIITGVAGAIFVCIYDIIMGKPVNDITGPKSIIALIISGLLIITGLRLLLKEKESKDAR